MPTLHEHYAAMRRAALPQLARGEAELDPLLDAGPADRRRGLTLLARPPAPILTVVEDLLADLRRTEPDQYYYPVGDVHLTVLSLISCYPGFELGAIDPSAYRAALAPLLAAARPFRLTFSGFTAAPAGLLVQGYPQGEGLAELRAALREFFQRSQLPHTIDQRYRLQTAHATVVRFRSRLRQPDLLLQKIARYQHYFMGTFEVNAVELVYNDWYQRAANTILLARYPLGRPSSAFSS